MIAVENISIRQGSFELRDLSISVPTSSHIALMGETGSGKTTLLEIICGLRTPRAGKVIIDGQDVTHLKPAERGIGYVPQDGALFPTMNVREHLEFALAIRNVRRQAIVQRVRELAELLGIAHLLDRGVLALSGGESQRVALGRAIAFWPSVLLLDEPWSAVDDLTRERMREVVRILRRQQSLTILHVTHYSEDAAALADSTLRLSSRRAR